MAGAKRYDAGKPALHYLHPWYDALCEIARVCTSGEAKYARGNYLLGQPYSKLLDAGERHRMKFGSFQYPDRDDESGCVHLAHSVWNDIQLLQQYLAFEKVGPDAMADWDDRLTPPTGEYDE